MRIAVGRGLALVAAAMVSAPAAALAQGGLPANCRFSSLVPRGDATEVRPGVFRYVLEGDVTVRCDEGGRNPLVVIASRVEYVTRTSGTPGVDDTDVGWMLLIGKVTFSQPEITVYAERARVHHQTKLGTFYDAIGFTRIRDVVDKTQFGGGEPEFAFRAERIEKTGPSTYKIVNLLVTSCMQPVPRWDIAGSSGTMKLNDHVTMRNAVLRVKGVPVLYVPYFRLPNKREDRSTGLLMPSFGSATDGGYTLSNAFFWAMSRSQDMTFYYDHFTQGQKGLGAEYRYVAAPGSLGNIRLYGLRQPSRFSPDGVTVVPEKQTYDLRASLNQELPRGFRLIGNINYFTDALTQQLFQQNIYASSSSTRTIQIDLSGNVGARQNPYRVHAGFQQTDVFNSLATGTRSGYAPRFGVSTNRNLGESGIHVRANVDTAYVLQQSDLSRPDTNLSLWRVDASPYLSVPLFSKEYLRASASANWRLTYWSDSQDAATRQRVDDPIGRQQLRLSTELVGPTFEGTRQTTNSTRFERIKHVIEPTLAFSWASPDPSFNNIVQVDAAEAFTSSQFVYGLSNRWLVRRRARAGASPGSMGDREILRVDLTQTYYQDARAASFDPNYQTIPGLAPPGRFSPLQFVAQARPADMVDMRMRVDVDSERRRIRTLDASGRFHKRNAQGVPVFTVQAGWTKQAEFGGLTPLFPVNSLNASFSSRRGRVGGTYAFNVDVLRGVWVRQRIGAFYNAQCCGVTFDYGIVDRSHFNAPPSRTFGLTFSLAGVGSFVTPLGAFGR